jgi:hypothetical protein
VVVAAFSRALAMRAGVVVVLGTVLAVSTSVTHGLTLPLPATANSQPPSFLSDYVTSLNYSNWNSYGCDQAETTTGVSSSSVILDFGTPWDQSGEYGTKLRVSNTFARWDSGGASGIRFLVANFLTGYWNCHTGSTAPLFLIIGVNNVYSNINTSTYTNASWMGEVVGAIDSWLHGQGWSPFEVAYAGSDTETEYASYSPYTLDYLSKVAATDASNPIYDFGDAGGCSSSSYSANGPCNGCNGCAKWVQSQVLEISWAETWAFPLPEIYNQAGAQAGQWYEIDQGSKGAGDGSIAFNGELTQHAACAQYPPCNGTDNTPGAGWSQLYGRVGGTITWSDDIRYLG